MKVLLADSPFWKDLGEDFQEEYVEAVETAYEKAAKLLPFGSKHVTFVVQPREYGLIDVTHDSGRTANAGLIELAFDPKFAAKQPQQILRQTDYTVFHEMNHAVRFNVRVWHESFLDNCVFEGLATVFERDQAGHDAPWAKYDESDTERWLQEIKQAGKSIDYDAYMYKHPDGRRWIGYKTGTYIIDRALKNSGKTVTDLTKLENEEILKLAKVL
jgi:uncharacterized protein YjaZ